MSLLTRAQAGVSAAISRAGTTCTVEVVAPVYSPSTGAVTETVTTHLLVPCTDVYDEVQQLEPGGTAARVSARMIMPSGLAFTPALGMRVLYQSRRWQVDQVEPIRLQGGVAAYQLAVTEIGATG